MVSGGRKERGNQTYPPKRFYEVVRPEGLNEPRCMSDYSSLCRTFVGPNESERNRLRTDRTLNTLVNSNLAR